MWNRGIRHSWTSSLNRNRFGGVFWAIVATLSSFVGNPEIKPSNKTKEEIVEGFSVRLITPPRACEPVLWQILEHNQDKSVAPGW